MDSLKETIVNVTKKARKNGIGDSLVYVSSNPEVISFGTIEVDGATVRMMYDPLIMDGTYYLVEERLFSK